MGLIRWHGSQNHVSLLHGSSNLLMLSDPGPYFTFPIDTLKQARELHKMQLPQLPAASMNMLGQMMATQNNVSSMESPNQQSRPHISDPENLSSV